LNQTPHSIRFFLFSRYRSVNRGSRACPDEQNQRPRFPSEMFFFSPLSLRVPAGFRSPFLVVRPTLDHASSFFMEMLKELDNFFLLPLPSSVLFVLQRRQSDRPLQLPSNYARDGPILPPRGFFSYSPQTHLELPLAFPGRKTGPSNFTPPPLDRDGMEGVGLLYSPHFRKLMGRSPCVFSALNTEDSPAPSPLRSSLPPVLATFLTPPPSTFTASGCCLPFPPL